LANEADMVQAPDPPYEGDARTGIWKRRGFAGILYSDGDEIETRIARVVAGASNRSVLSSELRSHCTDWASLYHLSPTRSNILRPFSKELPGADVLEIGAGCGAITRFLGEVGARVVAVEGSLRRAGIAKCRTQDLENIIVIADRFSDFETQRKFDIVTLIGVLEYANLFSSADDPVADMLLRTRSLLRPKGKLIIAIENQLGLKYFAGAPEDHVGQAMYGLEGRYRRDQAQTFGRRDLEQRILACGFAATELFLPFPDYKLPYSIVADHALNSEDFDGSAFAWQNVYRDPQLPRHPNFSQELVWPQIFRNGLAADMSNSFLVVGHVPARPTSVSNLLAWHYGAARKPEFCKETVFERQKDGSIHVRVTPLGPPAAESGNCPRYQPKEVTTYHRGRPMLPDFLSVFGADGWSVSQVVELFENYRVALVEVLASDGIAPDSVGPTGDFEMPGAFLDAIPQNLLWLSDGSWHYFDREWAAPGTVSFRYLVFRSLTSLSGLITSMGRPKDTDLVTWGDLIERVFDSLQLGRLEACRSTLIGHEAALHDCVFGGDARRGLESWFSKRIRVRHALQDRQRADKLARILTRILRQPWRPITDALRYRFSLALAHLSGPFSKRRSAKFRASAAKRDPRRFKP
jgi:2-polyprenyl-3-methyl-5-hydroxy-6-metoxy-1,4-benzoquinol methylase